MRFDSVLGIKQQLCEHCDDAGGVGFSDFGGGGGFGTFKAAASTPQQLGVALGVTLGRGAQDFQLAIRLTRMNAASVQYAQQVASKVRGEVDIQRVGVIQAPRPLTATQRSGYEMVVRPLRPGYSVAHCKATAGTIGAFVRDANGTYYILSNNHVLANSDRALGGDCILQPGPVDGGTAQRYGVARLHKFVTLQDGGIMDAAIAKINPGLELIPSYANMRIKKTVASIRLLDQVWKVGRTTGLTTGTVRAVGMDNVPVNYDGRVVYLDEQIEIEGDSLPFSKGGDSGSLVLDLNSNPVGLLFAGSEQGGHLNRGVTYASPLTPVLKALNVSLVV